MAIIKTREYLNQTRDIDRRIHRLISASEHWMSVAEKTNGKPFDEERVQTTPIVDPMAEAVAKAVTYEAMSKELVLKLVDIKHEIEMQINAIQDALYYDILYRVYIEGQNLMEAAVDLSFSYRHMKRTHNQALDHFESLYGDEYLDLPFVDYRKKELECTKLVP